MPDLGCGIGGGGGGGNMILLRTFGPHPLIFRLCKCLSFIWFYLLNPVFSRKPDWGFDTPDIVATYSLIDGQKFC